MHFVSDDFIATQFFFLTHQQIFFQSFILPFKYKIFSDSLQIGEIFDQWNNGTLNKKACGYPQAIKRLKIRCVYLSPFCVLNAKMVWL